MSDHTKQPRQPAAAVLEPPERSLPEVILIWFLQVVGVVAAIVFGVFSTLSWFESVKSTNEAALANAIALVSLCTGQVSYIRKTATFYNGTFQADQGQKQNGTEGPAIAAVCSSVSAVAQNVLLGAANSLFSPQHTPTSTASSTSAAVQPTATQTSSLASFPRNDNAAIIGGVVGAAIAGVTVIITSLTYLGSIRYVNQSHCPVQGCIEKIY
jgi:hypothetical protein